MLTFEILKKSFGLLTPTQKFKYRLVVLLQLLSSLLDLVAIACMGLLSIAVTSGELVNSQNGSVFTLLRYMRNHTTDEAQLLIILAVTSISLFLLKSVVSLYFARRILHFLSNRAVEVSYHLFEKFGKQSLIFIQRHSSQEVVTSLTSGVTAATLQVLGSASILLSEIGLLAIVALGLMYINPTLTIFTLIYFTLVFYVIQFMVSRLGIRAGRSNAFAGIQAAEIIQESVASFREVYVSNKFEFMANRFLLTRKRAASSIADSQWVGLIPKYTMESSLILGGGLLAGFQLLSQDSVTAIGTLAIFLAAGSRVLPSILRIQGAISSLQASIGPAEYTFRFMDELAQEEKLTIQIDSVSSVNVNQTRTSYFNPSITLESVMFAYPQSSAPALSNITLSVTAGHSLAIVGTTGAGKSTLADLILGLIQPQSGKVTLSGVNPRDAMKIWPGKVGYVPQLVGLFNSSVRENVAIGLPLEDIDDLKVWAALEKTQLSNHIQNLDSGLSSQIGERGVELSGGQKQRLGLARALYNDPELLILDEATSALDSETENAISVAINSLPRKVTVITIAHRLATIRKADKVIYLENGQLIASGSFEEIRKLVPNFDHQAKLMGL